jgi:hypothetical protein
MRCITVENTLFKNGDGANIFHTFNPIQAFLHKKLLLTRCGVQVDMLVVILLHNGYFLKYIEIIFFFNF